MQIRGPDWVIVDTKRDKALANWQVWFNKTASSVRLGVERANATMKNWYGMGKVRYRGVARHHCPFSSSQWRCT